MVQNCNFIRKEWDNVMGEKCNKKYYNKIKNCIIDFKEVLL